MNALKFASRTRKRAARIDDNNAVHTLATLTKTKVCWSSVRDHQSLAYRSVSLGCLLSHRRRFSILSFIPSYLADIPGADTQRLSLHSYWNQSGTNKTCLSWRFLSQPASQTHSSRSASPFLSLSSDLSWFKPGKVFTTDRQWSSIIKIATRARFSPTLGRAPYIT